MMTTLLEELRLAERALADASDTPRLDAEILMAHALGVGRSVMLARLRDVGVPASFSAFVERRKAHEPIAYILGEWEFYSLTFEVAPPVLVPRPETEHLVEAVLENVGEGPARILDVGAGTGCVGITLATQRPAWDILATDNRPHNVALTKRNAIRHEVDRRVTVIEADLLEGLKGPFDVICSNPPYVAESDWYSLADDIQRYEDKLALTSGSDGLDAIRALAAGAPALLVPGGLFAFEFGFGQHAAVEAVLRDAGYIGINFKRDLAGIPRIAWGRRP